MSIDLAAVFAVTEAAVASMVATSGTTVDVTRTAKGRGSGTVDPETLEVDPDSPTAVVSGAGAILGPLGGGQPVQGTATDVQYGDMVCVLLVGVTDIKEQDEVTVVTCRDPRLAGRPFDVVTILDSSAGAARVLHIRPRGGAS